MQALVKGVSVVCGAIVLSVLGLYASDEFRGLDTQIAHVGGSNNTCPSDTVLLQFEEKSICVDMYEVSPHASCHHQTLNTLFETEENLNQSKCSGVSVKDAVPWGHVSLPQAQRLCSAVGKRLPTSAEWYRFVLGTQSEACVLDKSEPAVTGSGACVSDSGVYDGVGNMWEWVHATIVDGNYQNRTLPEEGYVTSVDTDGVAITSAVAADSLYGSDYMWSKQEGVYGMIRGGFYNSGTDGGVYAVNAAVPTSFSSQGIGFRCVKDL